MKKVKQIDEELEARFVDILIQELPNYGIDTSNWEYNHGDCCYGGAVEFLARCIKSYANKNRKRL